MFVRVVVGGRADSGDSRRSCVLLDPRKKIAKMSTFVSKHKLRMRLKAVFTNAGT
jgi:hypothetical protein